MGMGAETRWQDRPAERWWRERHEKWQRSNKGRERRSIGEYAKSWWQGEHHRCACGCGQAATMFRNRRMYAVGCVDAKSKWGSSGLPEDRTPPIPRWRKRQIRQNSRWHIRSGGAS